MGRAPKDASFLQQSAYRPFRVIQGRFRHQSKGRMRLVINSNFGPILHRLRYGDLLADCEFFLTHSHLTTLLGWTLSNFWINFLSPRLESLSLSHPSVKFRDPSLWS